MKRSTVALVIVLTLGLFSVSYGNNDERIAIIEDQNGNTIEAKNLRSVARSEDKYYNSQNKILIHNKDFAFDLFIPLTDLIAINLIGDTGSNFEIVYDRFGQEKKVTTFFVFQELNGEDDVGPFSISYRHLKRMKFDRPPKKAADHDIFHPEGYLILIDGTKLEFKNLKNYAAFVTGKKRHYIDPETSGPVVRYTEEKKYGTSHSEEISFKSGKSMTVLNFKKIKSIEFVREIGSSYQANSFKITLKNDRIIQGQISGPGFLGLTGSCEMGDFYVDTKKLRAIYFQ